MTTGSISPPLASNSPDGATRFQRIDRRWILAVAVILVLAVDQVSKEIALHGLLSGPTTVGGVQLNLVANRGVLFGFPAPLVVVVIATIGVIAVAVRASRGSGVLPAVAYGLLVGGALGNLADRFQDRHFFPPSAVVDWIVAGRFTFNLADVSLVVAIATLLLLSMRSDPSPGAKPAR